MDRFLASQSASRSLAMAMPLLCDFLGPGAGRTTNNTGAIQPGALPNFNAFLESGTGSAAQKPGTKEVSIAGMAAPTEKTTAPNQDSDDELEIVAASLASEGPPQYVDMKFTLMFDQPVEVWIDCVKGIEKRSKSGDTARFLFLLEPDAVTCLLSGGEAQRHAVKFFNPT